MSKCSIWLENELKSLVNNALIILASKNSVCLIIGNHRIVIIIMDGLRKYRVIQKKCKSLGESSSVQCLLHPTNFLFCKCTNVLANREKKNFLNISKMQKVVTL